MSVSIRLAKFGKKNAPSYRLTVIPKRTSRQGRALEVLGTYNPSHRPVQLKINKERLKFWQKQGAKPSLAVQKIIEGQYTYHRYQPGKSTSAKG